MIFRNESVMLMVEITRGQVINYKENKIWEKMQQDTDFKDIMNGILFGDYLER